MDKGTVKTLALTYYPSNTTIERKPSYSIDNPSVVNIKSSNSSGVTLSAKSPGTATLTVKCGGKEAKCTIDVLGFKYNYRMYKLKEATIYSNNGEWEGDTRFIFLTNNPDPEEMGFSLKGENGETVLQTYSKRPSELKKQYPDINIPDKINNEYVYITRLIFTKQGPAKYQLIERDGYTCDIFESSNKISIAPVDYNTAYNNWINSYLNKYSTGAPSVRLEKICKAIKSEAKYGTSAQSSYTYSYCSSLRLASKSFFEKSDGYYHYDSALLLPIDTLARRLGATSILTWNEAGKDYSRHAYLFITFNDGYGQGEYCICPKESTAEPLEPHKNTLTLSDYEMIGTFK